MDSRPQPLGRVGGAEDIDYQLKACEAARQLVVRFIKKIVEAGEGDSSPWAHRWAAYSNVRLRQELEDLARRCGITEDRLKKWVGDNPPDWERATILIARRAICAVFTFAILNGRIEADDRRLQFGLACADEYFRQRRTPANYTHAGRRSRVA